MTQEIITGIIVAACVAYMLRKLVFKKKSASGEDQDCGSSCKCCSNKGSCH